MTFDKGIFERFDLSSISSYILDGAVSPQRALSYAECLQRCIIPIYERLVKLYKDSDELNAAIADLYKALNMHEAIFIELGMKAGSRLLYQLLLEDDPFAEVASDK